MKSSAIVNGTTGTTAASMNFYTGQPLNSCLRCRIPHQLGSSSIFFLFLFFKKG
ncbi:hypothetical protein LguiA_006617 [Lonicera macranthoides]